MLLVNIDENDDFYMMLDVDILFNGISNGYHAKFNVFG